MSSVLLIRPLCNQDEPEFAEPLGIERLAGYLRAHGSHDVRLCDRRLFEAERHAGKADEQSPGFFNTLEGWYTDSPGPQLVGFSLMTSDDVADALRVLSRLRTWWPRATFAAGGMYVTTDPQGAARRFPKDLVLLQGEGEQQLLALADAAENKSGHGAQSQYLTSFQNTSSAQIALDPNRWEMPLRPNLERYARLGCAVNMQTSRGCPGACRFCATPALPNGLNRWRPRDLVLIADELQAETRRLERAGLPPIFNFVDDDFGSLARLEALAELIVERGLHIAFACEMRFSSLASQPSLATRLARLHERGLTRLFFGLESLDPNTLATWNKPLELEKLPEILDACKRAGITVQTGYILWHASQTVPRARTEVEKLHQLGIYSHRAALSRLIVFPGCALSADGADEQGFQSMSRESERFYQNFCAKTAKLTQAWTKAAIAEPYATAEAFLNRNHERLEQIKQELVALNTQSFKLFMEMSTEKEAMRHPSFEKGARPDSG